MNNRSIPSMHAERKITIGSHKHSLTPYPSLRPNSQTDGMTDREMNTLAARGLEELFFQLCCCVVLGFWREIGFGVTYLRILSTIQLWRCVSFWFWREIDFGVTYVLRVQNSCVVASVFWLWWEIVVEAGNSSQNENTF